VKRGRSLYIPISARADDYCDAEKRISTHDKNERDRIRATTIR